MECGFFMIPESMWYVVHARRQNTCEPALRGVKIMEAHASREQFSQVARLFLWLAHMRAWCITHRQKESISP